MSPDLANLTRTAENFAEPTSECPSMNTASIVIFALIALMATVIVCLVLFWPTAEPTDRLTRLLDAWRRPPRT